MMIRPLVAAASLAFLVTADSPLPTSARVVEIVGFEYAFKAPAELPPGPVVFRFANKGKVEHELSVVLLAPGVSLAQFIAATKADSTPVDATADAMIEATVGVLFAGPGASSPSALTTELLPGRVYALRCMLRDSARAPAHQTLGMFSAIRVRTGNADIALRQRTDTIVATDYAFRYPRTLTPGVHQFALVNAGKHRHEVLVYLLKRGVTMQQVIGVANGGGNPTKLFDAGFGVLYSPAGTSPRGRLQIHLLPGRDYMLACTFQDSASAPPHFKLGMFGRVHVNGTQKGR